MRLLITGASGLLGLNLALQASRDHTVTGVDRCALQGVPFEQVCADLLEPGACERLLEETRPEGVIHCAALASLEGCEADPILAERLNAILPGELAKACASRGLRLVQLSTDAVFDGTREGIYTEEDLPNPQGIYARTKLEGERNTLLAHPGAAVARVNFFGWSPSGNRSISEFFFNALSAGRSCNGFQDVWFCPMFVGDLAELLLRILEKGLSGVHHAVGAEPLTKFEFGLQLARRFGFDESLVQPIPVDQAGLAARRSHNLRLSVHKLSTALGQDLPGFSTGLDRLFTQYQQGYPQKIRSYSQAPG